jgi:hypothetical protein
MYKVCADINDVEYRPVLLDDKYQIRAEQLLRACDRNTKLIWICSPNNPTGNKIPFVVTHIPVHTSEVEDRWKGNIHGHLHDKIIDDSRYVNVSCEQTGYTPVDKDYIYEQYSLIR